MDRKKIPATPAIHFLRENEAEYKTHLYKYDRSGAKLAAEKLGEDPSIVLKTLVMEDDKGEPFFMLMHGDKDVSTKRLARQLNVKSVYTCSSKNAQKYTGYLVGGISPFGARRKMPVYIEEALLKKPRLFINAGRRGFLVEINAKELIRLLNPKPVNVAT